MVRAKVEAHSVAAPRVADLVNLAKVKAVRVKAKVKTVIKAKKYTMASLLLLQQAPKLLEMALNGALQKGENPSIRAQENRVILAKASDF